MSSNENPTFKKGRGAQVDPDNRFLQERYETEDSYREHLRREGEDVSENRSTRYLKVYPKSILNPVRSPDIQANWSMNPYQGCEHGCGYCYARVTHEYWGYRAGTDFEQNILVKENAPALLEKALQKPSWQAEPIMLSGNTDCYQPAEKEFNLTRKILKIMHRYRQPVGIITKNALVLRDLDILQELAQKDLVHVSLSITTLDEDLRRRLEPRTATGQKRLQAVEALSQAGVPVNVMIAPIIPGLNSSEVFAIAKAAANAGARSINYTMVRLNGAIGPVFKNWLEQHYPDRAAKVLHLIEETHGGKIHDSHFGRRMRGEGPIAQQVKNMIRLARKKYLAGRSMPAYNRVAFIRAPKGQLGLF